MPILPYASFSNSVPPLYQPGSHQSTFTSPLAQTELPAYSRNRLLAQEEIEPDFPSNPRPVSERRPSTSPLHRPNQIHAPKSKGQHSRTRPEPSNGMKIQKEGTTLGKMDSQKKVITREDRGSQHGGEQVYPGHPVQRSSRPSRSVARNLGRTDVRIGNKEVEIMPRARMYHHPGRNHGTRHTPRGHRSDPEARSSSDHDDQSNRSDDDLSSDELDDPISLKDSGHDESDDEDELGDNDDRTEDEISLDDDEDGHGDENGDPEVDVDGGNRRPLIPKPEGEAGRPGRGGYTLSQSLGWKTKEYRRFTGVVKKCMNQTIDISKGFGQQQPESINLVCKQVIRKLPFISQYEDAWPVHDVIRSQLKYQRSRKRLNETKADAELGRRFKKAARRQH